MSTCSTTTKISLSQVVKKKKKITKCFPKNKNTKCQQIDS